MSTTGAFLDSSGLEHFYSGLQTKFAGILSERKTIENRMKLVEAVNNGPKNRVNTLDAEHYNGQGNLPNTIGGVKYSINQDGSISTYGHTTATRVFKVPVTLVANVQYMVSGCPQGGSDSTYRVDIRLAGTTNVVAIDYGQGVIFTPEQTNYDVCIRYPSSKDPNETFPLMICTYPDWLISEDYVPYNHSTVYGVGYNIYATSESAKDLDNYKDIGRYYADTNCTSYISNKPLSTTTAGFQLTVERNGPSNGLIQTITYNTTTAGGEEAHV